jgi:hypothetical protein
MLGVSKVVIRAPRVRGTKALTMRPRSRISRQINYWGLLMKGLTNELDGRYGQRRIATLGIGKARDGA